MNYYEDPYFMELISEFVNNDTYNSLKDYIQHGTTSIYEHSINVAYKCYEIAIKKNGKYDIKSLVRGAMLHDYFLYDWHKKGHKRFHGFNHPFISYENAKKEFNINKIERDIILKHMWPLTFFHIPLVKESWLVSIVDKRQSIKEINFFRKKEKQS